MTTARNPYIEDAFRMRESRHMNRIRAGERMEGQGRTGKDSEQVQPKRDRVAGPAAVHASTRFGGFSSHRTPLHGREARECALESPICASK